MKRIAILLLSSLLITFMMPDLGLVNLKPSLSQKWAEESVIAPFDVPLLKSESELAAEKKMVREHSKPVFRFDLSIAPVQLKNLLTVLTEMGNIDSASIHNTMAIVEVVYNQGIIPATEVQKYEKRAVLIADSHSNTLSTHYIGAHHSPESALEKVMQYSDVEQSVIVSHLVPNLLPDARLTESILKNTQEGLSSTSGVIRSGEPVVTKGQIVDESTLRAINSYNAEVESRLSQSPAEYLLFIARFIIVLSVLLINYLFFTRFAVHYFGRNSTAELFVLMLYILTAILLGLVSHMGLANAYIIPIPIVVIYLLTFFNTRVAILGNISISLICSMFVSLPFEYLVTNLLSGLITIFVMRHFYQRGMLISALGSMVATQLILYVCFAMLRAGTLVQSDYYTLLWIVFGGVIFLGLYQLIYLVEKLFGSVSDVSLLEPCDTNHPLLLQLAQNAPGTFQHSVQVANLAESVVKEIGGKPLLARTGALYHDVGKLENPFSFVENLSGTFSPHNDLNPHQSAKVIKKHVSDGIAIAHKFKLPQVVIDFIAQHHGTSLIYYFFNEARKKDENVKEEDFKYDGPKPMGREVSICMMADAIEAASRSLPSYEKEALSELVDSIIDQQIRNGQFETSKLTFEEISRAKEIFKAKLNNIYHGRIAYPKREER